MGIGLRAIELLIRYTTYILKLAGWLDAAGATKLYRRSVKRWYWVLVYMLVELLIRCTIYILKLAKWLDAAGAAKY